MTPYRPLIQAAAAKHGIDPLVAETIVIVESDGRADAFRYELTYFTDAEFAALTYPFTIRRRVSSSYGLMQIMYPTALDMGFDPHAAPEELFVPETNLDLGCKYFASLLAWAHGDVSKAFGAYNGGEGGWNNTQAQVYTVDAMKQLAELQAQP
jgi:soluble lytic murein transglycosylase-like protein